VEIKNGRKSRFHYPLVYVFQINLADGLGRFSGLIRLVHDLDLKLLIKKMLRLYLIVIICFSSLLFSCQEKEAVLIRYAHFGVPNEPQTRFVDTLASIVKYRTEGRIEIKVYPNSQLGNISEIIDGVKYGFIGMSHHDFSSLSRFTKEISVFNAPYIFRDVEHAIKATQPSISPVLHEFNRELIDASNIRILGSFYRGTRQLTTSFPVYSVDDLKGKKIRGVPFPIWMSMIKGMGAIPTPVEFSELTTALLTGMVVGQENPLSNIYASRIYEVQSHIIMTHHMHSCLCVIINDKLWKIISEDDQEIMNSAIMEAGQLTKQWILDDDERIKGELVNVGLKFIDEANGLELNDMKQSVLTRIKSDFPQWESYINSIENVR
jgi:tripartite ATP-independent transporter DctP family solute receptor